MDRTAAPLVFVICLAFLTIPALAQGPTAHLTEDVRLDYFSNGSQESASRIGYVEVEVPNIQDVLQYIRLNLSGTAGTNLQSVTTYNSVAVSPNIGDRTRIFLNTTGSTQDVSYTINDTSLVPDISLGLDYSNLEGGQDILSGGENTFLFNLTLNCTQGISGVSLAIQTARDVYNGSDSMNLSEPRATSSTTLGRTDTDSDGYYDRIDWTGDLNGGAVIYFNATLAPGTNFDESGMYLDLDPPYGINSTYYSNQTFTGLTFAQRFSRGPVRQGVDMLLMDTWRVKGFIKNIASGLNYSVHGWDLYEIDDLQTPVSSVTGAQSLVPGETEYTSWHDTGGSAKAYYTVNFDWEVDWGVSNYSGYSQGRMKLPALYEMDTWVNKTLALASNTGSGRTVRVNDTLRHLGHSSLQADRMEINSTIPSRTTANAQVSWQAGAVEVSCVNSSGAYDITSNATIAKRDSNSTDEGFVNVTIANLTGILGHSLGQNEDIRLSYIVSSPSSSANQVFEFPVTTTIWTLSGTPATESATGRITIAGLGAPAGEAPPTGGGGPAAAPVPVASIVKELGEVSILEKNTVEVMVLGRIYDSGTRGMGNITLMLYIPAGSEFNASGISIRLYDNSTGLWERLEKGRSFSITDMGIVSIGERQYSAYQVKKREGEWQLYGDDRIEINYSVALPIGTHHILTRISGHNYYTGKTVFEDIYTPIIIPRERVEVEPLEIREEEFEQGIAKVGKPIIWVKILEVYNPNPIPLEETFNATVFPDVLNAYLVEGGEEGHLRLEVKKRNLRLERGRDVYVVWNDKISGLETKRYVIEVTTPPILEEKRVVDVLESNETMVKFIINITLGNPALETYRDVGFELPINFEKVVKANDERKELNYTKQDGMILVHVPEMEKESVKDISVIYKEKPPILVINLDRLEYQHNSTVNLTGIVIPAEDIEGSYLEIEAMGPEPYMETIYIDISMLERMESGEKVEFSSSFGLSSLPTGKYLVDVRFRRDIWTILSAQEMFHVKGIMPVVRIEFIFFILAAALAASLVERSYIGDRLRKMLEPYKKLRRARTEEGVKKLERQLAVLDRAYRGSLISREAYIKDREKIRKRLKELGERLEKMAET